MLRAIRSWSWLLLLVGGLLFALMGTECQPQRDCEDIDDVSEWFSCVGKDIESWF
ncbi:MAG: hypothetical protein ACUVXJ_07560 [Phycisphaerae bacterium]